MPYKTPKNSAKKDKNLNLTGYNVITKFTVQTSPSKRFDRKFDRRVNMSSSGMGQSVSRAIFSPAKKPSTAKNSIIVISDSDDEDWVEQTRGERTASQSQISTRQGQRTSSQGRTKTLASFAQQKTQKTLNGSVEKTSNINFLSPADKQRSSSFTKPHSDFVKVPQKLGGAFGKMGSFSDKNTSFSTRSQPTQKMSTLLTAETPGISSTKSLVLRGKNASKRSFVSPPSPKKVMADHLKMLQKNRVTSQTSGGIKKGNSGGLNKNLLKNQIRDTKSKNYPNFLHDYEVIPPSLSKRVTLPTFRDKFKVYKPGSASRNLLQRSKEFFAKEAEKHSSAISKDKNQNILTKPGKVKRSSSIDRNSIKIVDSVELRKVLNNKILGSGSAPSSGEQTDDLVKNSQSLTKVKHRKTTVPPCDYTDETAEIENEAINDLFQNSPSDEVIRTKLVDEVDASSPESNEIFFDCPTSPIQGQRSSTENQSLKGQSSFAQGQTSLSQGQSLFASDQSLQSQSLYTRDQSTQGKSSFDPIADDGSVSEHSLTNITDDQKQDLIMTRQSNGELDDNDLNFSEQIPVVDTESKSVPSAKRRGAKGHRENKRQSRGTSANSDRSRGSGKSNSSLSQEFMERIIDDFIKEANSKVSRTPTPSKVFTDASNRSKKIKNENENCNKNKNVKEQSEAEDTKTINLQSSTVNIPQENCSKSKNPNSGDIPQSQNRLEIIKKRELRKELFKSSRGLQITNLTPEKGRENERREAGNFFQNFIKKSPRSPAEIKTSPSNKREQESSVNQDSGCLVETDNLKQHGASKITECSSRLPSMNVAPEKGSMNEESEAGNFFKKFISKSQDPFETESSSLKTKQDSSLSQDSSYFVETDSRKRARASDITECTPPKRLRSFIDIEQNNKKMRSIIDSFLDDAKKKSKEKRMEGGSPLSRKASFVSPPSQQRRFGLFHNVNEHPVTKMMKNYTMNSLRTSDQKSLEMGKNTQNLSPRLGSFVKSFIPNVRPKTAARHELLSHITGKPQETRIKPSEKRTLLQQALHMASKLNSPKPDLGSNVTDLVLNARSEVNERSDAAPDTNVMPKVNEQSSVTVMTSEVEGHNLTASTKSDGVSISSSPINSSVHLIRETDHESHKTDDHKSSHEVSLRDRRTHETDHESHQTDDHKSHEVILRDYYIELTDDEDDDVIDLTQSDDEAGRTRKDHEQNNEIHEPNHKFHEANHENRILENNNKTSLVHVSVSETTQANHKIIHENHEAVVNRSITIEDTATKITEIEAHNHEKRIKITGKSSPHLHKTTHDHEENHGKIRELDHENIGVNILATTRPGKNILPSTPEDIFAHVSNALNDVISSAEKQNLSENIEDDTITQVTNALERAISQVEVGSGEEKTCLDVTTAVHDTGSKELVGDLVGHGTGATATKDVFEPIDGAEATEIVKDGTDTSRVGTDATEYGIKASAIEVVSNVMENGADAVVDDIGTGALDVGSGATISGAHAMKDDRVTKTRYNEIFDDATEATETFEIENSPISAASKEQMLDSLDHEAENELDYISDGVEEQRLKSNILIDNLSCNETRNTKESISEIGTQRSKSNNLLDIVEETKKQRSKSTSLNIFDFDQDAGFKNIETENFQDNSMQSSNSDEQFEDEEDLPFLNTPKRFSQDSNSDDDFMHERKVQRSMFDIDQFFDDIAAGDDDHASRHTEPEMNDGLPEIVYKNEIQMSDAESDENMDLLDELPDITETPRSKKRRLMEKSSSSINSLDKSEKMMSQLLNYSMRSTESSSQESSLDGSQLIQELDELSRASPRSPRNPRKRVRSSEAVSTLGYQPSYSAILIDTNFSRSYKKHGPCIRKLVKEKQKDYEVDKMEKILLSDLKKGGFRGTLERAEDSDGEGSSAECDEDTKKAINLMKEDWGTLPQLSSNSKIFKGGKLEFCEHSLELKSCFTPSALNALQPSQRKVVLILKASTLKQHKGFLPHLLNSEDTSTQTHRWLLQVLQCHPDSDTLQRLIQSNLGENNCNQSVFNHTSLKSAITGAGIEPTLFGSQSSQKIMREDCRASNISVCQNCLRKKQRKKPRNAFNILKVFSVVFHLDPDILTQSQQVEFATFLLLLLQDEKFIIWSAEIVQMLILFLKDIKDWSSMKFLIVRRLLKFCAKLNIIQELCGRIHFNVDRLHELSRIISFAVLRLNVFVVEVKTVEMDNFDDIDALIDIVDHLNPDNLELLLPEEESSDDSIGSQKRSYYHLSLLLPLLNICIGDECNDSNTMNTLERITSILRTMNKRIRDNGAIYRSQVKYELSLFTKNLRSLIQKAPKKNKASIFKYLRAAPVHEQVIDNSFEHSSDESSGNEADVSYQDDDETDVKGQSSKFKKTPSFSDGFDIAEVLKSRIIGSAGKG